MYYISKTSICSPIIQEILHGVPDRKRFLNLTIALKGFYKLDANSYSISIRAAQIYLQLCRKGIIIRKPNDCLIASYALEFNFPLVLNDKDFDAIATIFPLKIFHPEYL